MRTGTGSLPVAVLAAEIGRLADRLRTTSDVRLRQPLSPEISRSSAALDIAQQLADAGQGVVDRDADAVLFWRVVPDLGFFALGDQVAVTGLDLLAALRDVRPDALVWGRGGQRTAGEVVAEVTEAVRALRLVL